MGALRATELARYGMIGVGEIYRLFASGELDADDEVAMVFDQSDFSPISDPLVNIRIALDKALLAKIISKETKKLFLEQSQSLYFPERTFKGALALLEGRIPEEEWIALHAFHSTAPDAKRSDAIQLLKEMKSYLDTLNA